SVHPSPRWGEGVNHPPLVPPCTRGDCWGGSPLPVEGEGPGASANLSVADFFTPPWRGLILIAPDFLQSFASSKSDLISWGEYFPGSSRFSAIALTRRSSRELSGVSTPCSFPKRSISPLRNSTSVEPRFS